MAVTRSHLTKQSNPSTKNSKEANVSQAFNDGLAEQAEILTEQGYDFFANVAKKQVEFDFNVFKDGESNTYKQSSMSDQNELDFVYSSKEGERQSQAVISKNIGQKGAGAVIAQSKRGVASVDEQNVFKPFLDSLVLSPQDIALLSSFTSIDDLPPHLLEVLNLGLSLGLDREQILSMLTEDMDLAREMASKPVKDCVSRQGNVFAQSNAPIQASEFIQASIPVQSEAFVQGADFVQRNNKVQDVAIEQGNAFIQGNIPMQSGTFTQSAALAQQQQQGVGSEPQQGLSYAQGIDLTQGNTFTQDNIPMQSGAFTQGAAPAQQQQIVDFEPQQGLSYVQGIALTQGNAFTQGNIPMQSGAFVQGNALDQGEYQPTKEAEKSQLQQVPVQRHKPRGTVSQMLDILAQKVGLNPDDVKVTPEDYFLMRKREASEVAAVIANEQRQFYRKYLSNMRERFHIRPECTFENMQTDKLNQEAYDFAKNFVNSIFPKLQPNMFLLNGDLGTGKTVLCHVVANRFLQLCLSDENYYVNHEDVPFVAIVTIEELRSTRYFYAAEEADSRNQREQRFREFCRADLLILDGLCGDGYALDSFNQRIINEVLCFRSCHCKPMMITTPIDLRNLHRAIGDICFEGLKSFSVAATSLLGQSRRPHIFYEKAFIR